MNKKKTCTNIIYKEYYDIITSNIKSKSNSFFLFHDEQYHI